MLDLVGRYLLHGGVGGGEDGLLIAWCIARGLQRHC